MQTSLISENGVSHHFGNTSSGRNLGCYTTSIPFEYIISLGSQSILKAFRVLRKVTLSHFLRRGIKIKNHAKRG